MHSNSILNSLALWMPRSFGINNQQQTTNTYRNTSQQPAVFNRIISYVDIVSLKKETLL